MFITMSLALFIVSALANAQTAPTQTPCEDQHIKLTYCNTFTPEKCPNCIIGYCITYNLYNAITAIALTDFFSLDKTTNKGCTCYTKEEMAQLCYIDFFQWAPKNIPGFQNGEIAITYLQPCWHTDLRTLKIKSYDDLSSSAGVAKKQNTNDDKKGETTQSDVSFEVVLDYNSPCNTQQVCCSATQKVVVERQSDGTYKVVYIKTIIPPSYVPDCKQDDPLALGECSSLCSALIFDGTKRITEGTEQGYNAIFPNPTNGIISLIIDESKNITDFEVCDMLGNIVYTLKTNDATASYEIDLNSLQNGIYNYRLISSGTVVETGKIVLAK
jgi:hypothetical protein